MYGHKKSGTALLLFRYLRLWYCLKYPNKQHRAHADMYERARTLLWYGGRIYISRGHQNAAM